MKLKHDLVIDALVNKVTSICPIEQDLGLLNGLSGHLLFLSSVEKCMPGTIEPSAFQSQFDRLHESLGGDIKNISLGDGLTGIGFAFELILQILDLDENINEDIDLFLSRVIQHFSSKNDYELLNGLTGILWYAVQRYEHKTGAELFHAALELLLNLKIDLAEQGIAWSTPENSSFRFDKTKDVEFNLGLAHGNFGVLAVLVRAFEKEPSKQLEQSIERLVTWLIAQGTITNKVSCYGYCCGDEKKSRLAWCYGDLTGALVLWRAGKALNDSKVQTKAKAIAELAAGRRIDNSDVADAGLCHGFAGNAVLFQNLYQQMQSDSLKVASDYWYALLDDALESDVEHFKGAWRFDPISGEYKECFGLLEGYSGIGLALLSRHHFVSEWQTCLLMD